MTDIELILIVYSIKGIQMNHLEVTESLRAEKKGRQGSKSASDGSTASYYELPSNAKELQDLISFKDMNAQVGEIFRACYRYGEVEHSPKIRDIKKIIFYATEELKRLGNLV